MIGRVTWVDYTESGGQNVARVCCRMEDGSRRSFYCTGVKPWGFVPEDTEIPDRDWIESIDHGYTSLFDDSLKRVVTSSPSDVNSRNRDDVLTSYADKHFECDLPMYRKMSIIDGISGYIDVPETEGDEVPLSDIDLSLDYDGVIEPRVMIGDIEVSIGDETFRETRENASQPVNVICCYDSYEEDLCVFFYDKHDSIEDKTEIRSIVSEQWDHPSEHDGLPIELQIAPTEEQMFDVFLEYLSKRDFDLTSGWNWEAFDWEYLIDRAEKLNQVSMGRASPFGKSGYSHNRRMKIRGLPSFDMMTAMCDKLSFTNWRSKSLDYVSSEELGVGKIDDVDINEDWKNHPEKLIGYNIVDVLLTVALDEKNDIHNFFYEMADVCSIPIYDVFLEKRLVDGFVMSRRGDDEVLPSADESELIDNAGGFVAEPIDGVKEHVGVVDLQSLYPSAIISWNLSTETVAETPEDFDEYVKVPKVPEPKEVHGAIKEEDIEMNWLYASLDKEGLIPKTVRGLFEKRNREKERMYNAPKGSDEEEKFDRKQAATKVIQNSVYGNLSSKYYRLSNGLLGDAVTSCSRYTLWKGKQTLDDIGREHVYSDSVSGDRSVIVKNPDEEIRVLPIEEMWEEAETQSQRFKERAAVDGWKALSYNVDGGSEWKEIDGVVRHETDKKIVELQQAMGFSVTTEDHSYVVEGGKGLVEKTPSEVKKPKRVNVPDESTIESLDLYSRLEPHERILLDSRGCPDNPNEKVKKIRTEEERVFYGIPAYSDYNKAVFCKRHISGEDLESLIRLCGAYVADGSSSTDETTSSGKWGTTFSNSDKEWLEELREDYQRLFEGARTPIIESDTKDKRDVDGYTYSDDTYKLQAMNELSAVVFASLCGQKSRGKKVPQFVFSLPSKYKRLFIDSAVKGDGTRVFERYSEEYSRNNFNYCTVSERLCSGISTVLNQLNKKHFIGFREEKESYSIRTAKRYDGKAEDARTIERDGYEYVYDLNVKDNNNFVDSMGQVLLHNTDSHFVQLVSDTAPERVDELKDISEKLDDGASEIASDIGIEGTHPFLDGSLHGDEYTCMHWEAEKNYSKFLQLGQKKRYTANIEWKEGTFYESPEIDISGFENRRADSPEITAELQEKVIKMVLTDSDFENVSEYIRSVIDEIDENNDDVKKFALPGSINKSLEEYPNRQIPRACLWSNEYLDKEFGEGDDPFVYLVDSTPGGLPKTDVLALEWNDEIPDGFKLDKEAIIERAIRKPISSIIEEMGWTFDEIRSGKHVDETAIDLKGDNSNPFA